MRLASLMIANTPDADTGSRCPDCDSLWDLASGCCPNPSCYYGAPAHRARIGRAAYDALEDEARQESLSMKMLSAGRQNTTQFIRGEYQYG